MIPKILHRIWIGGTNPPENYAPNLRLFRDLHPGPDWEMMEWTDGNLPELACADEFNRLQNWVDKADLIKLEVLAQHGGVYLDHDIIPLRNMDDLLDGGDFLALINPTNIGAAVMGATEESRFFDTALSLLPGALMARELQTPKGYMGSPFLSEVLHKRLPDTRCLLPTAFFPLGRDEKLTNGKSPQELSAKKLAAIFPDSYGLHEWANLGR